MKLLKSLCFILFALLIHFNSSALDFNINEIIYHVNLDTDTATVEGLATSYKNELTIPETITVNSRTYTVTAIRGRAF